MIEDKEEIEKNDENQNSKNKNGNNESVLNEQISNNNPENIVKQNNDDNDGVRLNDSISFIGAAYNNNDNIHKKK